MPDGSLRLHALMHEVADPPGFAAVVEADLAIGVPARMIDPAAEVAGQTGHGVGLETWAALLQVPDLRFEGFAQRLIGIERENPVMRRLFGRPVLLARVSA